MDPVLLRAVERLLVVLFAGMAIYLGYRLFLAVPAQKNSDGKVTLPGGVEVVLSRVGPGAFFALFGTIALGLSLFYQVDVTRTPVIGAEATVATSTTTRYVGLKQSTPDTDHGIEQRRAQVTALLFTLNEIGDRSMEGRSDDVVARTHRDLRQVKLLLLEGIWQESWGGYPGFADWATYQNARGAPPDPRYAEPASLFHQGRSRP